MLMFLQFFEKSYMLFSLCLDCFYKLRISEPGIAQYFARSCATISLELRNFSLRVAQQFLALALQGFQRTKIRMKKASVNGRDLTLIFLAYLEIPKHQSKSLVIPLIFAPLWIKPRKAVVSGRYCFYSSSFFCSLVPR